MDSPLTRRNLLTGLAAATGGLVLLSDSRSARSYQANERLGIALVGCGGRGEMFVDTVPRMENLVALCDVNDERAAASYRKLPDVPRYRDWRRMLDERGRRIDGVIVAAPDHIHAPCSAAAIALGKHIFCEKPLTHSIWEARTLRTRAAGAPRVVTQMGNQGTASEALRRCCELIWSGWLGTVTEVIAWNEGGGSGRTETPAGEQAVPSTLQWDLWLGPVKPRPFHADWLNWHAWREFATGQLGNWATHTMNLAFKALRVDTLWDETAPGGPASRVICVEAEADPNGAVGFPRWEVVTYRLPSRGSMPPTAITWYNGRKDNAGRERIEGILGRKLDWGDAGERKWADHAGCLLVGSQRTIHSTGHNMSFTLVGGEQPPNETDVPRTLPRVGGPEQEWFDAIRGKGSTMSSFRYASRLAEFTHLGNAATMQGGELRYDPRDGRVVSPRGAERWLRREYRTGWSL